MTTEAKDWEGMYKSLQGTLNKRNREISRLNAELTAAAASTNRIEKDMEGLFAIVANTNPNAKEPISAYLEERKGQRAFDDASVSTQRSLGQLIADADEDFDDDKFAAVRLKLEEARVLGDQTKFNDALEMVKGAVASQTGGEEMVPLAEVQARAAELAAAEAARVDTSAGGGTETRKTLGDVQNLDLRKDGLAGMQAGLDAALDQMFS